MEGDTSKVTGNAGLYHKRQICMDMDRGGWKATKSRKCTGNIWLLLPLSTAFSTSQHKIGGCG
jgi:hypothetical protein